MVPLCFIISDCELIFSRALPVGIFRVWAEDVSLLRGFVFVRLPAALPACAHFNARFGDLWTPVMKTVHI